MKHIARHKRKSRASPALASSVGSLVATPLALTAGWIAYSALAVDHAMSIYKAIDAEWSTFLGERSGLQTYYLDRHGQGRPLVLLHSINAAGSAYEMRPLFQHYQKARPVFALDLPGFGFSERSDRAYSPSLYADAINDLIQSEIGEPVDCVALSLSCEFAARAAAAAPDMFHSLAFLTPTGFSARENAGASQRAGASGTSDILYRIFAFPLWSQAFYDLLATRPSIDYFLKKSFAGPVDMGLADYAYLTAHQPGARHAPLYFVSGRLFTTDACTRLYEPLVPPTLVIYDQDPFVSFERLSEFAGRHSSWRLARITPTRGLPQFEKLAETVAALDQFWSES